MASKAAAEWKPETKEASKWTPQLLIGVLVGVLVGAILGIVGTYIKTVEKMAKLEDQVAALQQRLDRTTQDQGSETATARKTRPTGSKPEKLSEIIVAKQRLYVKESWGESAYQSFTDTDLKAFTEANQPARIVDELKHDNEFLQIVLAIRAMDPAARQRFLNACRKPLHQTWAQLGHITKDGQTEAGQKAELMIANAIVDFAKQLSGLQQEEIEKLYT